MPGSEPTQEGAPGTRQLLAVVHHHCKGGRGSSGKVGEWAWNGFRWQGWAALVEPRELLRCEEGVGLPVQLLMLGQPGQHLTLAASRIS